MWTYLAKVEKVVDGDTIDVSIDLGFNVWHKTRMRLLGIDTAEKNTALGKFTKQLLINVLEGKMAKVEVSKPDKYGRYLATVYLKKPESINAQMISQGLAKSYMGDSKTGLWTTEELNRESMSAVIE